MNTTAIHIATELTPGSCKHKPRMLIANHLSLKCSRRAGIPEYTKIHFAFLVAIAIYKFSG